MTIGGFHFGTIDVSIIVLSLIFAISGFRNGFVKEILGVASFVGAIVIAYFLANWVEDILVTTPLYTFLFTNLKNSVFSGNALYDVVIDNSQPGALGGLTDGLTQIGLPSFLASPLANILVTFSGTLGNALATASAYFIILILSYVAPFLIAWLLLAIISSLLVKLFSRVDSLQFIDSVLGIFLGLARAAVLVTLAIIVIIPVTFVVPSVNTFITNDLALNEPVFSIGNFIYTFVLSLIASFLPI
jgi:uncharacterized membrane protein required for colicin V production